VEKPRSSFAGRQVVQFLAMLPLTVPGLVLGLSYIFFFNHPANPFGFMYATMAILVMSTVTHFYTVSHLTAVTALKQMDREFESVSASLKVPLRRSFFKVTVPVCMPAILDISIYLFLNAMTTVSAVIFLYSSTTKVASVAAIHMDELGETASAAAMAMLIVYACLTVRLLHLFVTRGLLRRVQAWRTR
jgi:iron(III) transport system permease protein